MLSIGEIISVVKVGKEAISYSKKLQQKEETRLLLKSLETIYFSPESVQLLNDIVNAGEGERDRLMQRLFSKLLDSRYEVHRSLIKLEEEGFRDGLSLKSKRLFDLVSRGKVSVRESLMRQLSGHVGSPDSDDLKELLIEINSLNTMIEDLDDRSRERSRLK